MFIFVPKPDLFYFCKCISKAFSYFSDTWVGSQTREHLAKVQIVKSLMLCHLGFFFFMDFMTDRELGVFKSLIFMVAKGLFNYSEIKLAKTKG